MRKIRNFKLHLHFKDVRRRAVRKFDLAKLGLDDVKLLAWLEEAERLMRPAVIYETFGADSEDTAKLSPIPGLAHTLGLATLGPGLSGALAAAEAEDAERGRLFGMIASSALDQAVQFVISLLKDEVQKERCELSPIHVFSDPAALKTIFEKLGGEKIDARLDGPDIHPPLTRAFCLSWIAQTRRSKTGRAQAK